MLMTGEATVPEEAEVNYKGLDGQGVFDETCVKWPQENSKPVANDTGGCCWQWVDDGNRKAKL